MKKKFKINKDTFYSLITLLYIISIYALPYKVLYIEILFIAVNIFKIKKIKKNIYIFWNFCFLSICFLSIIYSVEPLTSFVKSLQILKLFIVGNIFICNIDNKEKLETIYNYFIISGFCLIIVLLRNFSIKELGKVRLGTEAFNANDVGLKLCISLVFCLYFIIIKYKQNILYYALLLLFYMFIFFTGSRKAFVFALLGSFLIYVLNSKSKIKLIVTLVISIMLTGILYNELMNNLFFYNLLGKRIDGILASLNGTGKIDSSSLERFHMIEKGLYLWNDKPTLGYGLDTYRYISGFGTYSHNNFIELLTDVGLLGLLIYYSIYMYILSKFTKLFINKKKEIVPIFIIILFLIPMGMALIFYDSRVYSLLIVLSFISIKLYEDNYKIRR